MQLNGRAADSCPAGCQFKSGCPDYMSTNSYEIQKLRGLKRKYEAVLQRGRKCERCGYDKNLSALEFHHRNPEEKEFTLDSRHFSNTKIEVLQSELDKCELLCANCHRELHNPDTEMSLVLETVKNCNYTSFSTQSGSICPVCGNRFVQTGGKIYCSEECRWKDKNYPSLEEVTSKYRELKSWEKVAKAYGLTRRIIQGIRKRGT